MNRYTLLLAAALTTFAAAPDLHAQTAEKPAVVYGQPIMLKDPFVAIYMSMTVPGLGQWYSGNRGRGLAFFAATVGALGATYGFMHPAVLELHDYDRVDYGGDGDGLLSVIEVDNWENNRYEDNAFEDLSTGRKVGAITSGVAALGFYIWNIIDARSTARDYNRRALEQRRLSLSLLPDPEKAGLALNLRF